MEGLPKRPRSPQTIHYQVLSDEPEIEIVELPSLNEEESEQLEHFHRYLEEEMNGGWDGPSLQVAEVKEGKIQAFPASYSWSLAVHNGYLEQHSMGQISALLAITGPGGLLWQKRSDRVLWGGRWDFSAGGGVDTPGPEAIRQGILKEAWEEIGAAEGDLLDLRPVMLAWGEGSDQVSEGRLVHRPIDGALVVWAARVSEDWTPRLGPEVSEVLWKSALETPGWVINQVGLLVPTLSLLLDQEPG